MQGLELSERYYKEIGRPAIVEEMPEVLPHLAAGLVGDGSECFGYDDVYSRDHDFGPGFCLWLTDDSYRQYGIRLQQLYDCLPGSFLDYPPRTADPRSGKRVGVFSVSEFYQRYIGNEQPPQSDRRWYLFTDDRLAAATNGKVFEDNAGAFSGIRDVLLSYYPESIRRQKIASCLHLVSQSGQYNYPRSLKRGDFMTAEICRQEFLRNVIHLLHMLNKKYEPYYKWAWRSFTSLSDAADLIPLLEELFAATAGKDLETDLCLPLIEQICAVLLCLLQNDGLTQSSDPFLDAHVKTIAKAEI